MHASQLQAGKKLVGVTVSLLKVCRLRRKRALSCFQIECNLLSPMLPRNFQACYFLRPSLRGEEEGIVFSSPFPHSPLFRPATTIFENVEFALDVKDSIILFLVLLFPPYGLYCLHHA